VLLERELERKTEKQLDVGKYTVGEPERCPNGEALRRRSLTEHQIIVCDNGLLSSSRYHEGFFVRSSM